MKSQPGSELWRLRDWFEISAPCLIRSSGVTFHVSTCKVKASENGHYAHRSKRHQKGDELNNEDRNI
jgi:hypothetical protein